VLLTIGRSDAAVRAARSHTGALTSDLDVVDAACRAAGVHRVRTPRELVDAVQALLAGVRPRGRRVAIVGDGGGFGALAADLCSEGGLDLPVLEASTRAELRAVLPPTASTANPVDLAGAGEQDVSSFARTTRILLDAAEVDAVLLTAYFGGYSDASDELRARELEVARLLAVGVDESRCPLVLHSMYSGSAPAHALRLARVPVYRTIESAVAALTVLANDDTPPHAIPSPPAAAPALQRSDYFAARAALAAAGVPFAEGRRVATREAALAAADEVGYPVVLKALGRVHKSEGGGVVLGVADAAQLAAALDDLLARLRPPELSVERYVDAADGFELLVGARRDPRFGAAVVVGAGGMFAEMLRDTAVALAPVGDDEARRLIMSLRAAPLLTGGRGRPPLAVAEAARVVVALSCFAAQQPEAAQVEINPLLVGVSSVVALDARLVLDRRAGA
jgi:acyl-CoA synthetase (NDP forming)